ncbi:MAG: peptidylprolyl isomerase [Solirubrobacteraceae bacterium]|nr:peptidylprolyl isomerase [Patulibacter sp.]
MRALASVLLLSATLAVAGCGSDTSTDAGSVAPAPAAATTPDTTAPASTPDAASSDSTDATSDLKVKQGTCAEVDAPPVKPTEVAKPEGKLDPTKKNLVTFETSCGTIVIQLDAKDHPITANAVAWLAQKGYYDKTVFHRVAPGFVVQGGDPLGTGMGGPSWKLTEPPASDETYPRGTFAMAKAGNDPVGTVNSQFFIMTGGSLDPSYAVAGKVISGMDATAGMEKLAAAPDGPPTRTIELIKATFSAK